MKNFIRKNRIIIYIMGCIAVSLWALPYHAPSGEIRPETQPTMEAISLHSQLHPQQSDIGSRWIFQGSAAVPQAIGEKHISESTLFQELHLKLGEDLNTALEESLQDQDIDPASMDNLRHHIQNLPADGVLRVR